MSKRTLTANWRLAALALPLLCAACAAGPDYRRPDMAVHAAYQAGPLEPVEVGPAPSTGTAQRWAPGADIPAQWWTLFHSEPLAAMVADAVKHSPTLDTAKAALRAARELKRAQVGAYYPTVDLALQPTRQRIPAVLASPAASNADLYSLTTSQVSVSYTPDLFGANRRAVEATVAQEDVARYELEAAYLTLTSSVVSAAIQDATLHAQIAATEDIVAGQRLTLASFRRQYELGQASQADLATQEAALAQLEASLPPLEKQYRLNRDMLAALLGRTPGEPLDCRFDLASLNLPAALPVSLPARLVEQRPDVLLAEAQLRGASAQVGIAAAARWPNVAIAASMGNAAVHPGNLLNGATEFWNIAASITQPIFAGGMLMHRQRAAEAAYDEALAQYRGAVVGAFQNVADALSAIQTDAAALLAQEAAERAAAKSLFLATRQLALGDVGKLAVIAAQQNETQSRIGLLQAQANRYADTVALFQALGGGWWNCKPGEMVCGR